MAMSPSWHKLNSGTLGKKFGFTFLSLLVVFGISMITFLPNSAYAADNNWFVGEGVKPNTFVHYTISHFDTNGGRPFEMTIYFKEFIEAENYWIAPVTVVDQGKVFKGTFHLSNLDFTALGGSDIPKEMTTYRSAYKNSLQWLSAYVPKPGQGLGSGSWGKIGSIGGSEIKPSGQQQITVPAFTSPVDTTLVQYHKGVDSKIWILNEFPYPIKALTFVDVTTGNPPVQYEFELLATGEGEPPSVEEQLMDITPPLTKRTERGDYFIELSWDPPTIEVGTPVNFEIAFMDNTQFPLDQQVSYNFKVTDANGTAVADLKNQFARGGTGTQAVSFNNTGPITVKVDINAVGSREPSEFIESAEFSIGVVPEFPASIAVLMVALTSIVALTARYRKNFGI